MVHYYEQKWNTKDILFCKFCIEKTWKYSFNCLVSISINVTRIINNLRWIANFLISGSLFTSLHSCFIPIFINALRMMNQNTNSTRTNVHFKAETNTMINETNQWNELKNIGDVKASQVLH